MRTCTDSLRLIEVMVTLLLLSGSVCAQSGTNQGTRGRTDPVQREMQRKFEMEIIENALRNDAPRQPQRYPPAVLKEIQTDFLRIQVVDRKLMRSLSSGHTPDLELMAKSAAEIRKRAVRLKRNLALPGFHTEATGSGAAFDDAPEPLLPSLSKLSNLIERFVANPIFKESRLMDMRLAARAQQDIEGIVEMSDRVMQSSGKLKGAAKAP